MTKHNDDIVKISKDALYILYWPKWQVSALLNYHCDQFCVQFYWTRTTIAFNHELPVINLLRFRMNFVIFFLRNKIWTVNACLPRNYHGNNITSRTFWFIFHTLMFGSWVFSARFYYRYWKIMLRVWLEVTSFKRLSKKRYTPIIL